MGWYWVAVICLSDIVLGERAVVWRGRSEDGVRAEVVGAAAAVIAAGVRSATHLLFLLQIVTYCLHGTPGSIATLSPTLRFLTAEPTSTTVPELSWPRTIGEFRMKSVQEYYEPLAQSYNPACA
jgi:hypothetical protein